MNHEINDRGKYQVRLYNPVKGKFQIITIDDYIPVDSNGTPLFAKARAAGIWCAYSRRRSPSSGPRSTRSIPPIDRRPGYESIMGNHMTRAFHVMTGDNAFWILPMNIHLSRPKTLKG